MWLLLVIAAATTATAPHTQHVPGVRIARAVEQALGQQLASAHSTATVAVAERLGDQVLSQGALTIETGAVAGPWPRLRAGVPVRLMIDGRTVRTLTVWVEAHDARSVLTYGRDYAALQPGSEVQMNTAVVDMACCPGLPVSAASQVAQLRSKRCKSRTCFRSNHLRQ